MHIAGNMVRGEDEDDEEAAGNDYLKEGEASEVVSWMYISGPIKRYETCRDNEDGYNDGDAAVEVESYTADAGDEGPDGVEGLIGGGGDLFRGPMAGGGRSTRRNRALGFPEGLRSKAAST